MTARDERRQAAEVAGSLGVPFAHCQWAPAKPPPLPWAVYRSAGRTEMYADNSNYAASIRWALEIYSESRDYDLEDRARSALREAGLPWSFDVPGDQGDHHLSVFYFETVTTYQRSENG